MLQHENEYLRREIELQHAKNRAYARLLDHSMHGLDRCVSSLRDLVHSKTLASLELHKNYIDKIRDEQTKTLDLEVQNSELEEQIFELSRSLRKTLRQSTMVGVGETDIKLEESPDYVLGLIQTLSDGLNTRFAPTN